MFPRAMVLASVLHAVRNLSWQMDQAMPYVSDWLAGLKAIVTLFALQAPSGSLRRALCTGLCVFTF